jgi:nucleotide-binding universal stress UspA family protein
LVKGWAHKEIPALVRDLGADLVVMGTVARTGISGLLMGNTAEMILTQIDCSVLAVKPQEFVSPVTLES